MEKENMNVENVNNDNIDNSSNLDKISVEDMANLETENVLKVTRSSRRKVDNENDGEIKINADKKSEDVVDINLASDGVNVERVDEVVSVENIDQEGIDIDSVKEVKSHDVNTGRSVNKSTSKKESKKSSSNTTVILLVSILLSFVCGMMGAYLICQTVSVEQVVKNITTSELVENSISSSVDKVYGSTVVVVAYKSGQQISTGTGFIYKKSGNKAYVMTNNHVVDGADSVEIEFNDSSERIKGKILGGETYSDIAVLTIDDSDEYSTVELGDSNSLKLGDTVFTVGSPMGIDYKGTVTKGILSGKDRMVEVNLTGSVSDYYMKVMQLDAAVNPGNSGGPLCDVSGKVIGIISLKIVQDEVEGMGFAIPIEDAIEYATAIEEGGEIVRPYLGISMLDLSDEYALWQNRITIPDGVDQGIAIVSVEKGSPAAKAGLAKGDIIVGLGDEETLTLAEFRYELYRHDVGEKVKVTFYRDGKVTSVNVTLGKNE